MAGPETTEFCTITFTDSATETPAGWAEVTSELKDLPGVNAVYFGRTLENSASWLLVVQWVSESVFKDFNRWEGFQQWSKKYQGLVERDSKLHIALSARAELALGAPCTEVFTGYNIEPVFVDNMAKFARGMDAALPEGYHGIAWGRVEEEVEAPNGKKGPAGLMILGWHSKEVHNSIKSSSDNPIIANIHYLRAAREEVQMYHVELQKL